MFYRDKFFYHVRKFVFGGRLTKGQVDGINRILDFWIANNAAGDLRKLSYMLATVTWETAKTMQPITEQGSSQYLKKKKYWPFVGRGLVQLTWEENYEKMSEILKKSWGIDVDLVKYPEKATDWDIALPIMFEGMFQGETGKGDFTGKALEDYFTADKDDAVGARAIINGTDKARQIADIYDEYCFAFLKSLTLEDMVT